MAKPQAIDSRLLQSQLKLGEPTDATIKELVESCTFNKQCRLKKNFCFISSRNPDKNLSSSPEDSSEDSTDDSSDEATVGQPAVLAQPNSSGIIAQQIYSAAPGPYHGASLTPAVKEWVVIYHPPFDYI